MEFTNVVVDRFVLGLSCNKIVNDVQIKVSVEDEITIWTRLLHEWGVLLLYPSKVLLTSNLC